MNVSRRSFLKLAAAGAAIAIVPVQIVEAIAPMPAPVKVADVVTRRLWGIKSITHAYHAADRSVVQLALYAGTCRMDIELHGADASFYQVDLFSELEIDLRFVGGRLRLFINDQEATAVGRLDVWVDRPMIDVTSWSDDARQFAPGYVDDEPVKQLTAYKRLQGDKA